VSDAYKSSFSMREVARATPSVALRRWVLGRTYTGLNAAYCRVEANAAVRYDYTFDKLRRLTQEVKRGAGGGTPLHYQKDFGYDRAGNRTSYRHQNGPGYNYGLAVNYNSYSYDVMGRLTQIRDSGREWDPPEPEPEAPAVAPRPRKKRKRAPASDTGRKKHKPFGG